MHSPTQANHHTSRYGLLLITAILAWLFCMPLCAGNDKKSEKDCRKQCKKEVKRLQTEGWKVFGIGQALEEVLMSYYLEVADGALFIHVQQEGPNINVALSKAKIMAQKSYAEAIESVIKAEVETEMKNIDSSDDVKSEEHFRAVIQQKVDQHIQGFVPRFTLTREKKDGHVEVQQFYTYKFTD